MIDALSIVPPKTVQIQVTAEDIAKGIPFDGDKCAIALAAKRVLGRRAYMGCFYIHVSGLSRKSYLLPRKAVEFRRQFDAEEVVQPIIFTVELEHSGDRR